MQDQVSDGPVLLLRISAEEYATIQEVFSFVPHMDLAIIGFPEHDINRLAARFAEAPFSALREKDLRLAQDHLSCLCSVFAAHIRRSARGPMSVNVSKSYGISRDN